MIAETDWRQDREAFEKAAEPYRRQLQVHCYRMLGSLHDAEDMVQETFLRAWRAREGFEGRTSFRNWLYRIATNVCLNAVAARSHKARVMPDAVGPPSDRLPLGEPTTEIAWIEPYPDLLLDTVADNAPGPDARYELRESVQLAFIAAVQQLPARQRAVLLLRDVLGWSAAETAQLLDTTVTSINSALQRARATLGQHDQTTPSPTDEVQRDLIERYVRSWETLDMDGFIALLKEDVVLRMPPWPRWYRGRDTIRAFFEWVWQRNREHAFRIVPFGANGQLGFAQYARVAGAADYQPHSFLILTLHEGAASVLTGFRDPSLFPLFDLPASLLP